MAVTGLAVSEAVLNHRDDTPFGDPNSHLTLVVDPSEPTVRILVTGSPDWTDVHAVTAAILEAWLSAGRPSQVTIVHGACPTGTDSIAAQIAARQGFILEPHPIDWRLGRSAGAEHNSQMVAAGADVCLAFIGPCSTPQCWRDQPHDSHGAASCANMAQLAGIPTYRTFTDGRPAPKADAQHCADLRPVRTHTRRLVCV